MFVLCYCLILLLLCLFLSFVTHHWEYTLFNKSHWSFFLRLDFLLFQHFEPQIVLIYNTYFLHQSKVFLAWCPIFTKVFSDWELFLNCSYFRNFNLRAIPCFLISENNFFCDWDHEFILNCRGWWQCFIL